VRKLAAKLVVANQMAGSRTKNRILICVRGFEAVGSEIGGGQSDGRMSDKKIVF